MESNAQDLMNIVGTAENKQDSDRILDLLFSYMPRIAAERSLQNLLVLMADLGRSLVRADRCSLWLIDEDKNELWTKVAHGVNELRIPITAGFVGHSVKTGEALLVEDAYKDERFDRRSDEKTHYRTTSVMTVPLMNGAGNVMGVYQAAGPGTPGAYCRLFRKDD